MLCFLYEYIDTELVAAQYQYIQLYCSVCLQGRAKVLKVMMSDADRLSITEVVFCDVLLSYGHKCVCVFFLNKVDSHGAPLTRQPEMFVSDEDF